MDVSNASGAPVHLPLQKGDSRVRILSVALPRIYLWC